MSNAAADDDLMTINEKENNEIGLWVKFQLTEIKKTH